MVDRLSLYWCLASRTIVRVRTQKQQRKSPQSRASVMKANSGDWPSNSRARLMVMKMVRQMLAMSLTLVQGYSSSVGFSTLSMVIMCSIDSSSISTAAIVPLILLALALLRSNSALMLQSSFSNLISESDPWLFLSLPSFYWLSSSRLRMMTP